MDKLKYYLGTGLKCHVMEEFERLKENSNLRDMIYLDGVLAVLEGFIPTEREQIEEACNETQRQSVMMANNVLKIMGHPALFGFDKNHASNYYLNTYGNGE